jgi:hypothetical protein
LVGEISRAQGKFDGDFDTDFIQYTVLALNPTSITVKKYITVSTFKGSAASLINVTPTSSNIIFMGLGYSKTDK